MGDLTDSHAGFVPVPFEIRSLVATNVCELEIDVAVRKLATFGLSRTESGLCHRLSTQPSNSSPLRL